MADIARRWADGVAVTYSTSHSNRVVVGDEESHLFGQGGHGAVKEPEITEGERGGVDTVWAGLQLALGAIEERR